MASTGKRFRSSTACTMCQQMKIRCDRRERLPDRCTRCETTDSVCEISPTFERRRMRAPDEETRNLRQELQQLKAQVAAMAPLIPPPANSPRGLSTSSTSIGTRTGGSARDVDITVQRNAGVIILQPWQIDAAFAIFYRDMHSFLPFLSKATPNACYDQEPFLFWVICVLGLRSSMPDVSRGLSPHVNMEALQAPARSAHNQAAATAVVQGLLLLSLWPFPCPSLLHEASWLHCGSATHLALHIGLHQPYSASEFVPKSGREHIPNLLTEFRRTWIACYVINVLISFARGYPCTVKADFNVMSYILSTPEELEISADLHGALLMARRIEEGQDLGHSRSSPHGHIDPSSREGIYTLLQSRLLETEKKISTPSPYIAMIVSAAKLQPQIQVLQATSPLPLQETTVLAAFDNAVKVIDLARLIQSKTNMVHLPVLVDALVLMSVLLIFKIQISRFSAYINIDVSHKQISEACSYFRDGVNEFNGIPARVSIFVNALYMLVVEGLLPVSGFVIENTKSRYSQNILYEVLWVFKEWKRQSIEATKAGQLQAMNDPLDVLAEKGGMFSFLVNDQLDPGFWQMLGYEGGFGL